MANTVNVVLGDIGGVNIGAFDLYFYEPDGTYGWPVQVDDSVFPPVEDFVLTAGSAVPFSGDYWYIDTYINSPNADLDLVRGVGGYDEVDNVGNALTSGLFLTMSSDNTYFGINVNDIRNAFYESINYSSITGLVLTESWVGDVQTVTISTIPIPGAVWLLGSGLIGLVGIRRRFVS